MDLVEQAEDYCRAVEAYLCRRNGGHLIRIVGPAFDMVCGWANRGVPLQIVQCGIDRCVERYYAKGPRRRPVRIDFCQADVLDAFDEWRRAVGVGLTSAEDGASSSEPADEIGRRGSLPSHLERAVNRLTALRAGSDRSLDGVVDEIVAELDRARASARTLRGRGRADLLDRLAALDARLMNAARVRLTDSDRDALRREAEAELAPFRGRMLPAAYEQSLAACMDRLLRERQRLPTLSLE